MNHYAIDGVIGHRVIIPAWAEGGVVIDFCVADMSYVIDLDCGDEAYIPFYMVEVIN